MPKQLKPCPDCGVERTSINTDSAGERGLAPWCKACKPKHDFTAAARQKRFRETHPEAIRTEEGKERERARKREWARKNRGETPQTNPSTHSA